MDKEPVVEVERPSGVTSTHTTPAEDMRIRQRGAGWMLLAVLAIAAAAAAWFYMGRDARPAGNADVPATGQGVPGVPSASAEVPLGEDEVRREADRAAREAEREVAAAIGE